jgi:hypothetical protein
MVISISRSFALLAAAAIAAPTAALAQNHEQNVFVTGAMNDPEQHVFVSGAMNDPEQHVFVSGAMNDPEQHVTVSGAMNDPEQHVFVSGAAKDRAAAPAAEDPADRAIPELPVVYDAPAPAKPAAAADVGSGTRGGKAPTPR